jgi:hypothetical protein
MIYLANTKVIIQDEPGRTVIATMSDADVAGVSIPTMAKAMAIAPALLCFIDELPDPVEFEVYMLSGKAMRAIDEIRSAFTAEERVELTHYRYMLK